jgi:two-component system nitrogen regulation sensor histidine kinase NtrY
MTEEPGPQDDPAASDGSSPAPSPPAEPGSGDRSVTASEGRKTRLTGTGVSRGGAAAERPTASGSRSWMRISRIRLTRTGIRIVVGPQVPWWGRLESRVITALVALGILCVGASAYLVTLTVRYFDTIVSAASARTLDTVELARKFYGPYVLARKQAYRARVVAMARELEAALARGPGAKDSSQDLATRARQQLSAQMRREDDVVELTLSAPPPALPGGTVQVERHAAFPEAGGQWVWVVASPEAVDPTRFTTTAPAAPAAPAVRGPALQLVATFAHESELDADYQKLGQLRRELEYVAVNNKVVERSELERAVFRAIGAASLLVLVVAFFAGFALARATTRKLSQLTEVILRVASGDLRARVPELGQDELGQLGAAFNGMLDELDSAQHKLSYMQRIGAWQEMARRIAHEIKNPLTPIQLAVQQLREKDPGTDPAFSRMLRTSVEIVEDEIESLRRMVTSFSRFAKVPEAHLEPVEIARIVGEFDRAYGHLTEREADVLEVQDVPPGLVILGDRQLLKQCLVNLVENAVLSQRERGPVHVRVSVRAMPPEPGVDPALPPTAAELRVDDNGPGIAPERRERVFEPYESTRKEGTGLGLAIVKKVVLDHMGEVRIEDSELGGAAVVLRLPLHGA